MTKWTRSQVRVMALGAGWGARSEDVSWVVMAESGGDDKIVNSIGCVGLLQVNQPVHVTAHPKWTRTWLQDPLNNLTAGKILFDAAGKSFSQPWADSKHKGGIPEGWGPHVSAAAGGTGGATQAADDPCADLKGTPAYDYCKKNGAEDQVVPLDPDDPGAGAGGSILDLANQIGRIAQSVAKAGNWLANPENWVRIAYVGGGAVLALVAVNVIVQPYMARSYRQVRAALPVETTKKIINRSKEGQS